MRILKGRIPVRHNDSSVVDWARLSRMSIHSLKALFLSVPQTFLDLLTESRFKCQWFGNHLVVSKSVTISSISLICSCHWHYICSLTDQRKCAFPSIPEYLFIIIMFPCCHFLSSYKISSWWIYVICAPCFHFKWDSRSNLPSFNLV